MVASSADASAQNWVSPGFFYVYYRKALSKSTVQKHCRKALSKSIFHGDPLDAHRPLFLGLPTWVSGTWPHRKTAENGLISGWLTGLGHSGCRRSTSLGDQISPRIKNLPKRRITKDCVRCKALRRSLRLSVGRCPKSGQEKLSCSSKTIRAGVA